MHKMSNLEYQAIVDELSPKILNKHLRKFKKIDQTLYRLRIGEADIIVELGIRLHETKILEQVDLKDKFVEKAARELDNKRLVKLELVNNDRIVKFSFESGYELIFEMFGEGNAILVKDEICIAAQKYESWAGRKIAANDKYTPPSSIPLSKIEINDRYIIVNLMKLPLGKEYCIEILNNSLINEKVATNTLTKKQIEDLEKEIEKMKNQRSAFGFFESGKIVDYALIKLAKYVQLEVQEFKNLSEVCDLYYSSVSKANPEEEKLKKRLEKQNERLIELRKNEIDLKAKGDLIYANMQKIQHILEFAKKGAFTELEKQGHKVDRKNRIIEMEFE